MSNLPRRSIEDYFSGSASQGATAPSQTTLHISVGKRKRPVGRPRKSGCEKKRVPVALETPCESDPRPCTSASITGKRRIHKMYSRGQKNKVACYARHHGVRAAGRRYGVAHKNVQRWMKTQLSEIRNPGKRTNKKGQGRKISYPQEIEDQLVAWILEKREQECVTVSYQMIKLKALSLIRPTNPQFKATDGWLTKFTRRNNLVLRAKTHISQTLPKDLEEKITKFRQEVRYVRENSDYPYDLICNMDETPVFLDLVPNKTIDRKGKKTIHVRTTCSEKRRVTAALCCTASGEFLQPFVIFKGKTQRSLHGVKYPQELLLLPKKRHGWTRLEC